MAQIRTFINVPRLTKKKHQTDIKKSVVHITINLHFHISL